MTEAQLSGKNISSQRDQRVNDMGNGLLKAERHTRTRLPINASRVAP